MPASASPVTQSASLVTQLASLATQSAPLVTQSAAPVSLVTQRAALLGGRRLACPCPHLIYDSSLFQRGWPEKEKNHKLDGGQTSLCWLPYAQGSGLSWFIICWTPYAHGGNLSWFIICWIPYAQGSDLSWFIMCDTVHDRSQPWACGDVFWPQHPRCWDAMSKHISIPPML